MRNFTFAKGWWAVPLRGMAGNTADNDLTDKFVALITEEAQSFSCLVAVLVQGLVTVVRDTRVWAWVVFYCSEHTNIHTDRTVMHLQFMCSNMHNKKTNKCREGTYRHTLGCGRSILGCRCLVRGRRFGCSPPVDNPGYMRNERLFRLQNLFRGALSELRLPPLLGQDTAGLWGHIRQHLTENRGATWAMTALNVFDKGSKPGCDLS